MLNSYWQKACQIGQTARELGTQSVRKIAQATGVSKSAAHRHIKAAAKRNQHPESALWELPEGQLWLIRLVSATIFHFGIQRGVGAETISRFFKDLRIDTHVAISPTAIRSQRLRIEQLVIEYQDKYQKEGVANCNILEIIGGVDETFFKEMMILLAMDLRTGYILSEKSAGNRKFETWKEQLESAFDKMPIKVRYLVSDRAPALIKLATEHFECKSIADLFHATHKIAQTFSLPLHNKINACVKELEKIEKEIAKLVINQDAEPERQRLEKQKAQAKISLDILKEAQQQYRKLLHQFSLLVHPFQTEISIDSIDSTQHSLPVSSTQTKLDTTQALKPAQQAKQPTTQALKPAQQAKQPTTQALKPAQQAKQPTTQALKPTQQAKQPTTQALKPTQQAKQPTTQALIPARQAKGAATPHQMPATPHQKPPHELAPSSTQAKEPTTQVSIRQSSESVEKQLRQVVANLEVLASKHELNYKKKLKSVKNQLPDLACLMDLWWEWVDNSLGEVVSDPIVQQWAKNGLLAKVYWEKQLGKSTTNQIDQVYQQTYQKALSNLEGDPLTATIEPNMRIELEKWANLMVERFCRTTSAVEGRNGTLSQLNHCRRGFKKGQLPVLTVLHNFYIRRADGTTAAERFFNQEFPDLFEWFLPQIDSLPRPRASRLQKAI